MNQSTFLWFILLVTLSTTAQSTAPILSASGNQIYCPQTNMPIVTHMTIQNDSGTTIDAIYIQISEGYVANQDILSLSGNHPNIASNWNILEGKLTLSGLGTTPSIAEFVNAIEAVVFFNPNLNVSGERIFSITIGEANYLVSTGHYYQYISNIGVTWNNARILAENSTYYGLQGYLATITSMDEVQITSIQASGAGWIGGNDIAQNNVWRWVTGPENGTIFWNGLANGNSPTFAFWNTGEPNDAGGNESYAHVTAPGVGIPGSWNDLSNTGESAGPYQPKGYIVEYGGMPGDPILQIATFTSCRVPAITNTQVTGSCGPGTVTIQANSVSGNVLWYDSAVGGVPVFTGNSFTTPILTNSTLYYVMDAAADACSSPMRTSVLANIEAIPTIQTFPETTICEGSTVTLMPTANFGTIRWFESLTSTTPFFTGNEYETDPITDHTTFYIEAINNACVSERIQIQIHVNPVPNVEDEIIFLCENSSINLTAGVSNSSYLWYTEAISENILVSEAGNYFVTITNEFNCSTVKNFTIIEVETPIVTSVEITLENITILTENNGDFEYSIDGINYFESNTFPLNFGGLYTAYVREQNGCGIASKPFVFISFPLFFTPNNDGDNDFWHILGIENYPTYQIGIYDRFGKLLHHITRTSLGWNGTFGGKELPASDYWFVMEIKETNQIIKGHFSLVR
jgi:gliding motility-associated-like protein